ncbi:MAG: hypothetical protein ACK5VU_07775 [Burkholderiales bacterium]|jgi:hypothetical protein
MKFDVEEFLSSKGVQFEALRRHEMVKLLANSTIIFPNLIQSNRILREQNFGITYDEEAKKLYLSLGAICFFLLPSEGGLQPYFCKANMPPDVSRLTNDNYSHSCNELVLLDQNFLWCLVLVNHMDSVGWYFEQIAE